MAPLQSPKSSLSRLQRQQSSTDYQFESFDSSTAQYFCCFGFCHSKTVGVFIFLFELVELISLAVFLFLKSAAYNSKEWQSTEVLVLVGITLIGLIFLGISTALLFLGVCCEESSLIIPYMIRQALLSISATGACIARPKWAWHALPYMFVQFCLLILSYGTYKYFSDKEKFHAKPDIPTHKNSNSRIPQRSKLSQCRAIEM